MCGRAYQTFTEEELSIRYLNRKPLSIPDFRPNYNLAPTQNALVLRNVNGTRQFDKMRFGLVPLWADSIKAAEKYSLINAKGEEIETKRTYKTPFQKQRCLIPLSGFYEWKRSGENKRPFAIHLKGQKILSVAGVWESWVNKSTGEIVNSFAFITVGANDFMSDIHDRMPVILAEKDEDFWLDSTHFDQTKFKALLKPCPSSWLEAHEVSKLVNSPRNNNPDLLAPVDS